MSCQALSPAEHVPPPERILEVNISGREVEHPRNKCSQRSYVLPRGDYFVGDPASVLSGDESFYDDFPGLRDGEECFSYRGHQIICIRTGADGAYPLYSWDEDDDDFEDDDLICAHDTNAPVLIDWLRTDLAMLAIIPLELLYSVGMTQEEIEEHGFAFEDGLHLDDPKDDSVPVTFFDRGGLIQCVEFYEFVLLVNDKSRFEDVE